MDKAVAKFEVLSRHLQVRNKENHEIAQSTQSVLRPRFEPCTSRIQVGRAAA
jgi:hypothetical protein